MLLRIQIGLEGTVPNASAVKMVQMQPAIRPIFNAFMFVTFAFD
jgi:hypothetical protein